MSRCRLLFLFLFLCVALVGGTLLLAGDKNEKDAPSNKSQNNSKQSLTYIRPDDPALYVGSDTCKTCHADIYDNFQRTAHFATTSESKLDSQKGPGWHGCEACHGPGKEHVDGGGDKTKIFTFKDASPQATSARCLACHQYNQEHSNYGRSEHLTNGVGCIECHSPHHAKESQFLLSEKSPQLCYKCHMDVRAEFARPFHHRVNEGLVQCNDCHSPHGTFRPKQLRTNASGDEVCYKCHTEKQGPFVYQHEAKVEGCVSCHSPHGSTNARLLVQNQVNLLCMSCHSLPANVGAPTTPTFHNQAQKYQACTLCHTAIHGSNTSSVFFTP
jgi:DmsE family decaheme c-type cytochrome